VPHVPQLLGSVVVLTHKLEQTVCPTGQVIVQTPLMHNWPDAQSLEQAPQLLSSEVRSRHEPEQSVRPEGQTHLLAEQILPPLHFVPQIPQLLRSEVVSTQIPEQITWPVGQEYAQTPLAQS
jgi:hypothetical protein